MHKRIPLNTKKDVVIIGGGPAGSTTALYLARRGVDVLVIDGRDPIGTPLQCGELVPSNEEMARLCPKVPDIDDLFQTPDHAICRRIPEMHLVTPLHEGRLGIRRLCASLHQAWHVSLSLIN